MGKLIWLIVFIFALVAEIFFMQSDLPAYRVYSKPLVVLSLLFYFILVTKHQASGLKGFVIAALFFSLAGDVLLIFEANDPIFFMAGLVSFLIAHIFYAIAFNRLRIAESVPLKFLLLIPVVVYYSIIVAILFNHLDEMKIPVIVYAFAIHIMLLLGIHLIYSRNRDAGRLIFAGAVLFITSDTILAFHKFYFKSETDNPLIMISYGLTQLFLTLGLAKLVLRGSPAPSKKYTDPQLT